MSAARARLWASAALEEARRARGERRRRLACVAAGLVTEGAYRTYVVKLWVMCQLARRRAEEPVVPAYGVALGQVAKWIAAYPMLVDADAARIRNAIHHHHFEYPGRTIRLWDNRGWGLETDATELIERASTMLTVTWAFQTAMNKLLETNRDVAAQYYRALGIFQTRGPLTRGRQLHLQGQFDQQDDGKEGAKGLYMQARVPTEAIDQIGTNEEVQKALGLVRGANEGDFVWQNRLASSHLLATQAKQHSTYWLAISHYESGNYEAAAKWLQERTIDAR